MSAGSASYLLDTNIILLVLRGGVPGMALEATYGIAAAPSQSIISIVSRGEMLSLSRRLNWGKTKQGSLRALLDGLVQINIDNDDIVEAYAEIDDASLAAGRKMGKNDLWIAATARISNLTLLTTDQDFDHLHGTWIDRIWIDPNTGKKP